MVERRPVQTPRPPPDIASWTIHTGIWPSHCLYLRMHADIFMVEGLFAQTLRPPLVPGSEGVGTVASFSERFPVGQRVVAAPWPMFYGAGSWAEYCIVPEKALVAVPDSLPDEVAAQFFVSFLHTDLHFEFSEALVAVPGAWLTRSPHSSS